MILKETLAQLKMLGDIRKPATKIKRVSESGGPVNSARSMRFG